MTGAERITVTRWQCPRCRRSWAKRPAADSHMSRCWLDPDNQACKTCRLHEPGYDAGPCIDSDPHCGCNSEPESCAAGHDLTGGVRVGCPDWEPRLCVEADQ